MKEEQRGQISTFEFYTAALHKLWNHLEQYNLCDKLGAWGLLWAEEMRMCGHEGLESAF